MLRKLPLDLSTFSELRLSNYVYVDKTEYMYRMLQSRRFFLSRPRRFGKSLLVSTLKEILSGNKDLFNDLWISRSDYQWKEHGVINLDFSLLRADDAATFKNRLYLALLDVAANYDISISGEPNAPDLALQTLVKALHNRFGRVAVLVDNYDSPIVQTLKNPQCAEKINDEIQQFFAIIKSLDAEINFTFVTGVRSLIKSPFFAGMNNLQILSLDQRYDAICGYTDQEIDQYFGEYITAWAHKENVSYNTIRSQIKTWYNGYHFGEETISIYNPFSVMNAFKMQTFENFLFKPESLTVFEKALEKQYSTSDLERSHITQNSLEIFDIQSTPLLTLLFQTGYLTIKDYNEERKLYTLDYPNHEARIAANQLMSCEN